MCHVSLGIQFSSVISPFNILHSSSSTTSSIFTHRHQKKTGFKMPVTGAFKLTKSENFEEYMKAVGVGLVMRKMAATATPTTEISQAGEDWNIKTSTTFKTTEIKFKLGEEFDEETADGRKCKSTITLVGDDKLVHKQKCGDSELQILREFKEDEMTMTLEAPGVTSTRIYKKVT